MGSSTASTPSALESESSAQSDNSRTRRRKAEEAAAATRPLFLQNFVVPLLGSPQGSKEQPDFRAALIARDKVDVVTGDITIDDTMSEAMHLIYSVNPSWVSRLLRCLCVHPVLIFCHPDTRGYWSNSRLRWRRENNGLERVDLSL